MSRSWLSSCASLLLSLAGCSTDPGTGTQMDMGPVPDSQIRLAHYVSGLAAFDLCIKGPNDADFVGPIVRTKAMRTTGGVPFAYASAYMAVAPATYKARPVGGSAADCSKSILGVPDMDVMPFVGGKRYTIAAMGTTLDYSTVQFAILEDDLTPQAGQARVRFVDAAAVRPGLDLGSGSGTSFALMASASSYGDIGEVGGQSYFATAATTLGTFSLRNSGASNDLMTFMNKLTLTAGEVYTIAAIGDPAPSNPELSVCDDSAAAINGLTVCLDIR